MIYLRGKAGNGHPRPILRTKRGTYLRLTVWQRLAASIQHTHAVTGMHSDTHAHSDLVSDPFSINLSNTVSPPDTRGEGEVQVCCSHPELYSSPRAPTHASSRNLFHANMNIHHCHCNLHTSPHPTIIHRRFHTPIRHRPHPRTHPTCFNRAHAA